MNGKPYSTSEIKNILDMHYNKRMKIKEIAKIVGRTPKSVGNACHRYRDMVPSTTPIQTFKKNEEMIKELLNRPETTVVEEKPVVEVKPKSTQMSPREMIKHLYSLGYRIKDNQLIVLVEQKVNLKDIING